MAIFVCFTTRAIHIEAVSDLSTAAFIAALRRFIARRGLCNTIISDNATNFVGAKNELAELYRLFKTEVHQEQLQQLCQANRITWRTIPPKSPHFGGLWEAAVKQAKYHLVRVVANATLSFEELATITAQIEAILNSRPLTPISSDPSDLEALTPGHFLIGEPPSSFPEPDLTDANYNRLSRFRRLKQRQQHFWRRWSRDYLHLLQQRHKWTSKAPTLQLNTLVLIQDENLPPYKWPLGRVLSTIPGRDGVHRVAEIKTQYRIYKRAIVKLYPLPIDD
ncbi:uncharacterized protein LOC118736231 [Rhagoletis pomonella]|uniref:uncharacterized protein LOC118736231 n=1 Tax=Rhagoletis pomonella TaxID=28610 RepID=UPI00177AD851|nr:uncharacterized protein LOC118736231 [Rhagoletis pomonella]